MPIENELKFVIRLDDNIESEARKIGKLRKIEQGYIAEDKRSKITLRLRKVTEDDGAVRLLLQMKCKQRRSGVIEIGTDIDQNDFDRLWERAKGRLVKHRYCIEAGTNDNGVKEVWELDFFKTRMNTNYFVLAEIEIPEAELTHKLAMPELISGHVVYPVPRDDTRFSNRKLGNIKYATRLYRSVLHKELFQ